MGVTPDNWPATVGLMSGMLAKEVVIGSLNTLYSQVDSSVLNEVGSLHFLATLKIALLTIPENLAQIGNALANPISASSSSINLSATEVA